jgi:hypothetical protein
VAEISERDARILHRVKDADAVILVEDGGYSAISMLKGIKGSVPATFEVGFAHEDGDPPGQLRSVMVKAGWTLTQWRKLDRSGLAADEDQAAANPSSTTRGGADV